MNKIKYDCIGFGLSSWDEFMLVSDFPSEDEKIDVLQPLECPGGPVLNALRFLSALGKKSYFAGYSGKDIRGSLLKTYLNQEKIDIPENFLRSDLKTAYAHSWINSQNGSRTICSTGNSNTVKMDDHIKDTLLKSKTVLVDNRDFDTQFEILKFAKGNKIKTFCDFGTFRKGSQDLLKYIDFAIVSNKFINEWFTGNDLYHSLDQISALGPNTIIVSMGKDGAVIKEGKSESRAIKSYYFDNIVDSTGAGDIFHGAWIYGYIEGWETKNIEKFASAAGALQCLSLGTEFKDFSINAIYEIIENGVTN